jgi:hypothetical protein
MAMSVEHSSTPNEPADDSPRAKRLTAEDLDQIAAVMRRARLAAERRRRLGLGPVRLPPEVTAPAPTGEDGRVGGPADAPAPEQPRNSKQQRAARRAHRRLLEDLPE